jgi:hypothetical protein
MVSGIKTNKGEFRLASAANGTALSTTAAYVTLPRKSDYLTITPRNFATAVVVRIAEMPWLTILRTDDNLLTAPTDYSEQAQDASTATDVNLAAIDIIANGGALYVGSYVPFRGVYIDVDAANTGTSSDLTVKYWSGAAWTDISATDGTNGTESIDQDGTVTWTVPANWVMSSLTKMGETKANFPWEEEPLFWTRWEWDIATVAATANSIIGLNRSTAYSELTLGQALQGFVENGPNGISGLECLTNDGTANLLVNARTVGKFA